MVIVITGWFLWAGISCNWVIFIRGWLSWASDSYEGGTLRSEKIFWKDIVQTISIHIIGGLSSGVYFIWNERITLSDYLVITCMVPLGGGCLPASGMGWALGDKLSRRGNRGEWLGDRPGLCTGLVPADSGNTETQIIDIIQSSTETLTLTFNSSYNHQLKPSP